MIGFATIYTLGQIHNAIFYYSMTSLCGIRGVAKIWQGGAKNFFSEFEICLLRRGFEGMPPSPEKIVKTGAMWCVMVYILIKFCINFFLKSPFLYKKSIYSSYTFVLRHLTPENVLETMLQWMRFSVYFE